MKYKLQIEKLKQLKMDGNLSMANQFESQDEGYTPFEMDLLNQITELKKENEKQKEALFNRNKIISELDEDIKGLDKDIEELNDEIYRLNNCIKELKADNERLFNALPIELARGFSLWLLCNYFTPEPGADLCWINAETGTKHYNGEVFEIYLNGLK